MMETLTAYLQHGRGTQGPFLTERVMVKETAAPVNPYRTGYGSRVPTAYMVWFKGRWRRVYCAIYSNIGTLYIRERGAHGRGIVVDIYRE